MSRSTDDIRIGNARPLISPWVLAEELPLPDTLATRDGRGGLATRHGVQLLREALAGAGEMPLRSLVAAFSASRSP